MRELKILAVVVFFSLLTYYLVEPFAHHAMHMKVDKNGHEIHIESNHFIYTGKSDIEEAKRDGKKDVIAKKEKFWGHINKISALKGDAVKGEAGFAMCTACHSGANINMGGVIPPKLDKVGSIYDKNYLIALIKNPAMASNIDHKYKDTSTHPMASVSSMFATDQSIADVVAYIMAKKSGEITPKEAYEDACMRCHAVRYGKLTQLGTTATFKHKKDDLAYKIKVIEEEEKVKAYMGNLPPDLSMIIRARSEHFLETFIQNPQSQLAGTSMPRVGLNHEGYKKVMKYLEEVGDPSKAKREKLAPYVIGFFIIFTLLAYLWKRSLWRDLH